MTAVYIDATVVDGSNTKHWPSPAYPFYPPVIISGKTAGELSSPALVDASNNQEISIPIDLSSVSFLSLAVPNLLSEQSVVDIATPITVSFSAPIDLSMPVSISANALDPELPPFALNHARILYDNLLLSSAVTISTGATGTNVLIPNTAQRWTFSATGNIKFVLPDNFDIDTVCIGAHNLSSGGYTVQAFYRITDGGTLTSLTASKSPVNDNAIMFHIPAAVSAKVIEIYTTAGSGAGYIGSIYAGVALQMQRPFYSGHSPITLSASTTYFSSRSESGAFIGREIRKREYQTSAAWKNITDSWYRDYFQPFVLSAKTLPFYFAWNLLEHPTDVAYCITNADISPSYQGNRDLMQVGFDMIGVG